MEVGKLNWDDLKSLIEDTRRIKREEVTLRSGVGEDCSIVNFGDYECVISTDPITGADKNLGRLAVHINCNDVASCGVEPVGILVTILAPPEASFDDIKSVMNEIAEETEKLNVEILGGHTEVTNSVNKMIISCTVLGKNITGKSISTASANLGDDIIVTKHLGMEGSCIIVNDRKGEVEKFLTDEEITQAKEYINNISVVKEGVTAGKLEATAMHDITEGGVLGALWELAEASNKGFIVYENKMPITSVTLKICRHFNIDPLRLISSGSMLITAKDGKNIVDNLKKQGINAAVIGKITEKKGLLVREEKNIEVLPPERDELFKI